ncbi:hypothetical protein ACIQC7_27985 [Kitasatospora sp. NPDC088556]|uniref:hypothetical protein n=1 Tax=Kitasatospora sp. NPDC088556 TaxID=3364076 RepID=UPI0038010B67
MAINVGQVEVDVIPNTRGIYDRLKAGLLPAAERAGTDAGQAAGRRFGDAMAAEAGRGLGTAVGEQIGRQIANQISRQVADSLQNGIRTGGARAGTAAGRAGDESAGAFARAMRARLEAAFRSMPALDIRIGDTGVDAELARVRAQLQQLSGQRIGIDIGAEEAAARLHELQDELRRLGATHADPVVRADTAQALASLEAVQAEITAITRDPHEIELRPGQFRERLIAQVQAAAAALPVVDVEVATDDAQVRLARLRAEIADIPQRLATDATFDDAAALAAIARLRAELADLNRAPVRVDVRADAAAAEAQLAAVAASVTALDARRPDIKVNVDTGAALSALFVLGLEMAALGAIPVGVAAAAGLGLLASAAVGAGAGIGALALAAAPAVKGISAALQAQTAAQQESTSATTAGAGAETAAQQRALSLASAQQSLASARRQAAQQTQTADRQIADAERALADTTGRAAADREQAQRRVTDAISQAADVQERSAQQVADAERSLADAQRAGLRAQDELTAARAVAAQQLEDLNNRLVDGALDERAAALRVAQAEEQLLKARAKGSTATVLQQDQAQLAYDQAVQAQREQAVEYKRLQAEAARASAAGVDGADAVVTAQQRVADAQRTVEDRTRALASAQEEAAKAQAKAARDVADAQAAAAKIQVDGARQIADAQQRIADAQTSAAQAQQSAADSVASAQRGLQQALLSSERSTTGAASAADKYETALAKLSPQARQVFEAIAGPAGLKAAFTAWSDSVSPEVLPLFVRGVDAAKAALPGLTPLAVGAAHALGDLFDRAQADLKTPFWRSFKTDLDASVGPAVTGFGVAFGNTIKGAAGIIDAFLPRVDAIAARLESGSARFANWGAGLKGSPGFEAFLGYVERTGPVLFDTLGKIAGAIMAIGQASAPLSGPALHALGAIAQVIVDLATDYPGLVQAIWLGVAALKVARIVGVAAAAGMALYTAATSVATAATTGLDVAIQGTMIVPIIEAIVVAVIALVAGIIYAWGHVAWFRDSVTAAWDVIRISALWLWTNGIQPAFDAIWAALQVVGAAAMWLWTNALGPAFSFIGDAARVLFAIVVVAVVGPIVAAFNLLSVAAIWLWQNGIKPTFEGIATVATWLWRWVLAPTIDSWMAAFRSLADLATWLWRTILQPAFEGIGNAASWAWRNAIKPSFDGIASGATWLWENALRPAFDAIKGALTPVTDAFGKAKDLIAAAWNQVADVAKRPVNFVIQSVYTDGIKAVWDKVADFVHLPHLPDAPKLLAAGGTVGPGWGEAAPMVVSRPTAIVGEGNPAYPEYVIPTDPRYRARAIALHAAAGSQLLAGGGVIGSIVDTASSIANRGLNLLEGGADLIAHPGKAWDKLTDPVRALFAGIGDSPMAKVLAGIPARALDGLKDRLLDFVGLGGGSSAPPAGAGVQRWSDVVLQALAMVGQPAGLLNTTLRRMGQESGGNPTIVNTTDSNWSAGTPSVGLMQVIGPTFRAYAGALADRGPFSYGVSVDPLANVYSSMRYALSRYGSLSAAYDRPGGYDSGGYLPTGFSTVYNGTGRPEPVLTTQQWDAVQRGGLGGQRGVTVYYSAPTPEDPQKAAMEIGRRVGMAVAV